VASLYLSGESAQTDFELVARSMRSFARAHHLIAPHGHFTPQYQTGRPPKEAGTGNASAPAEPTGRCSMEFGLLAQMKDYTECSLPCQAAASDEFFVQRA